MEIIMPYINNLNLEKKQILAPNAIVSEKFVHLSIKNILYFLCTFIFLIKAFTQ